MQNFLPHHHTAANQVIIYLYETRILAIKFSRDTNKKKIFIEASNTIYANNLII